MWICIDKDDENLYHSDSDESLHQYRLSHQQPPPRPQSTLSLNQLCSRRRSNPDIYPGARRFSTSFSHEDILSNDQLDQIHFDPRYRDYRSASSLNNCRSRSNSLNSMGSGGNLIQSHLRRLSNHSPPLLGAPLIPQKRWDTNPSIFIEEYNDEEALKSKTESKTESKSELNSRETLCSSNESLQPLSESDIKSFGDLSQIAFIDEDSNDSAPCRFAEDDTERKTYGIMTSGNQQRNTCRKTVSFDVIAGSSTGHQHLFTNNGKKFPKSPHSNPNPTDKNHLFYGSHPIRANVRPSRDGINRRTQSHTSVPKSSPISCHDDDHCTLVDKLIRLRMEENKKMIRDPKSPKMNYKIQWDGTDESRVCNGKVKALTTYFNTLPYMMDDCNCMNVHQSTPDLSMSRHQNKLTCEEMEIVRKQLKEWSEFGLKKHSKDKLACSFLEHASSSPKVRLDEKFNECKQYHDVLNRLDKVEMRGRKNFHQSLENVYNPILPECFYIQHQRQHECHTHRCREDEFESTHVRPMRSEKHKCRSACFNIRDPAKKKKKKEIAAQKDSSPDDDNESFII